MFRVRCVPNALQDQAHQLKAADISGEIELGLIAGKSPPDQCHARRFSPLRKLCSSLPLASMLDLRRFLLRASTHLVLVRAI
jgi:hypothetical protein